MLVYLRLRQQWEAVSEPCSLAHPVCQRAYARQAVGQSGSQGLELCVTGCCTNGVWRSGMFLHLRLKRHEAFK